MSLAGNDVARITAMVIRRWFIAARTPEDLADHDCVLVGNGNSWDLITAIADTNTCVSPC